MDRGRITLPFLMLFAYAIALLGALYPVFADLFSKSASSMDTGTEYLFFLVLPLLVLTLISLAFLKARGGYS